MYTQTAMMYVLAVGFFLGTVFGYVVGAFVASWVVWRVHDRAIEEKNKELSERIARGCRETDGRI